MKTIKISALVTAIILCISSCGFLSEKDDKAAKDAVKKAIEDAKQQNTATTTTEATSFTSEDNTSVEITAAANTLYSVIPEGSYYDDNKYKTGLEMLYYLSDPEMNAKDAVSVTVYHDGTGVFFLSKNSAITEKGCFEIKSTGVECKYDSGKLYTFESLENSEDLTEIKFKVIDNGEVYTYTCYLTMATDSNGNILEGISYEAATTSAAATTTEYTAPAGTNEHLLNKVLEDHKNDSSGKEFYCEDVEEMTDNGTPCDLWIRGAFFATLFPDKNDANSGEGYITTLGLGSGYCKWSYMRGSGYYYIRWYPAHYSEGSFLDLIGCHMTTDIPDLEGSFMG